MNTNEVAQANLAQVLCTTPYLHNAQALADRLCDLTGMTTWVLWNPQLFDDTRLSILTMPQLTSLQLKEPRYRIIYCSDQPGRWIVTPEEIDPPLAFGHVRDLRQTPAYIASTQHTGDHHDSSHSPQPRNTA